MIKFIKNILLLLIVIAGFVLQAEWFQNQLTNYSGYYMMSAINTANEEMDEFLSDAESLAEDYGVSIFAYYYDAGSHYNSTVYIFGDSNEIREDIKNAAGIEEGTYTALISGKTEVIFLPFINYAEYSSLVYQTHIYYIGSEENIQTIYEELSEKYDINAPAITGHAGKSGVIMFWSMTAAIMFIFNAIDVLRRKKEVVLRRAFGENAGLIVFKTIIFDIVSYAVIYLLGHLIVFNFVSGEFARKEALEIYLAGCLISLLPYFFFLVFDVRKAFSNASSGRGILWGMYGLKLLSCGCCVFMISTSISSLGNGILSDSEFLEEYYNYNFIYADFVSYDDINKEQLFWDRFYESEADTLNPAICISVLESTHEYIFVNNNASNLLQDLSDYTDYIKGDSDVVIFVPSGIKSSSLKETAFSNLSTCFSENTSNLNIQYIEYSGRKKFLYLDYSSTGIINTAINPVVIYQNNPDIEVDMAWLSLYGANTIMLEADRNEIEDLIYEYAGEDVSVRIIATNVYDAYEYSRSAAIKLLLFTILISAVMMTLEVIILLAVNSMEFRISAMEISLKKIFGYGLYERHKRLFLISMISDFAVITAVCVLSALLVPGFSLLAGITTGSAELAAVAIILCSNAVRLENESLHKVLKGGCL